MRDFVVIGLGAMGSAALYQSTRHSTAVLGIDRFAPPHAMGSSHAETRMTRLAVGEGPQYLPFVARSHQIWSEIEATSGRRLLYQPGLYIITPGDSARTAGSHWDRFVERTAEVARGAGVEFERLSPGEARRRHPELLIRDSDLVGYEPSGGVVLCEAAVATQLELARAAGAVTRTDETVTGLEYRRDHVEVVTDKGRYSARKVVVTAGAWITHFLPVELRARFTVTRQVVYWFEVEKLAAFSTERFAPVIWLGDTSDEYFGAFPIPPGGTPGLKMLAEQFDVTTDADSVCREVTQAECDHFHRRLASRRIAGVTPRCLAASACLYTNTPDDHFVIDTHPDCERVMLVSACSGHAFKHSAAIGEALAQWAASGASELNLEPFGLDRLR